MTSHARFNSANSHARSGVAQSRYVSRRFCVWLLCCAWCIVTTSLPAHAATATDTTSATSSATATVSLGEYRERIGSLALEIDALLYPDEEDADDAARQRVMDEAVALVRAEIGKIGTITWGDQRITPDNRWVYEQLAAYEQGTTLAPAARRDLLRVLAARLQALSEQMDEAASAIAAESNSHAANKEATKRRLAGVLQRPDYNRETGRGGALADLWKRFTDWLGSFRSKSSRGGVTPSKSPLAQIVVLIVIALLIGVAIWKLLPLFKSSRFAGGKIFDRESRTVLGERLRPDERASDLLREAEALARAGDLRLAIRKGYIAFLLELSERRIIALAKHKTNRDYTEAIRTRRTLAGEMQHLTAAYEAHWYGDKPTAQTAWTDFRTRYDQALLTESG